MTMSDPSPYLSNEQRVKIESLKRARESHLNVYLTLTSIVQGAVLAYLLSAVSIHRGDIGIVGWVLASATFLLVVVTWNEYVMGVITFRWVPDLIDSAIPFLFGVSEYLLVNRISDDPTKWVVAFMVFSAVSFLAFQNMYSKARREDGHNDVVLAVLGGFVRVNSFLPAIGVFLSLTYIAIATFVGTCTPLTIATAGIVTLCTLGYTIRTWLYWRRFVDFARDIDDQLKLPFLSLHGPPHNVKNPPIPPAASDRTGN
jgi:hypothetical protein